jgi:hypothetical protein
MRRIRGGAEWNSVPNSGMGSPTSLDKALDLCEALSASPRGSTLADLARQVRLPTPTAHRLLAVLRRRGYVRQDEESGRYLLTLRWLDVSFRAIGRSEIRLHAYPVLRQYAVSTGLRTFVALPGEGEVSYVWSAGADDVSMYTAYGKAMPGHCSLYFADGQATRRLVCMKLARGREDSRPDGAWRLGFDEKDPPDVARLNCTCAPVHDYTGREVARVGIFAHGTDEHPLHAEYTRAAWELARRVSLRLGHLGAAPDD